MVDQFAIIGFHLFLRHAFVIVVGRGGDHILSGSLVRPFGEELRVEHHRLDLGHDGRNGRCEVLRKIFGGCAGDQFVEVAFGKFGQELVERIVVVYAVGEPHFLQVFFEFPEILARAVARVALLDRFERAADAQVVAAVLVEKDIASAECGLVQVIDQLFLFQREGVEARYLVAQHFDVVETVHHPVELLFGPGLGFAGVHAYREGYHHGQNNGIFHRIHRFGCSQRYYFWAKNVG